MSGSCGGAILETGATGFAMAIGLGAATPVTGFATGSGFSAAGGVTGCEGGGAGCGSTGVAVGTALETGIALATSAFGAGGATTGVLIGFGGIAAFAVWGE